MKKLTAIITAVMLSLTLAACGRGGGEPESVNSAAENSRSRTISYGSKSSNILVAYFSATGNTEAVANKIARETGGDIYEIVPLEPYTRDDLDYGDSQSRSSLEMNDPDARPAISGQVENIGQYDMIFIGYPIWWGEAPRIISTFIESYDFSGKTLVAFCTSASSGFGDSDAALKQAAGDARWLPGHRFPANASEEDVRGWLSEIKID